MRSVTVALFASLLTGCTALGGVAAGPSYAIAKEHQSAGAANGYFGVGLGDENVGLGAGGELRVKVGPSVGHVAMGPFFYFFSGSRTDLVTPFWRFGFNLLQFESVEGRFAFGMFSPRSEFGLMLRVADELGISLAIDGEYLVRFTDTPNTGYASFTIGFASAMHGHQPRLAMRGSPAGRR